MNSLHIYIENEHGRGEYPLVDLTYKEVKKIAQSRNKQGKFMVGARLIDHTKFPKIQIFKTIIPIEAYWQVVIEKAISSLQLAPYMYRERPMDGTLDVTKSFLKGIPGQGSVWGNGLKHPLTTTLAGAIIGFLLAKFFL